MLTGKALGDAIKAAIEKKQVTQRDLAEHFGVKPPSIQDWINRGTVSKDKLPKLWMYFSDVEPLSYWGLDEHDLPESRWPFPQISRAKLFGLSAAKAEKMQASILHSAQLLEIDLKPEHEQLPPVSQPAPLQPYKGRAIRPLPPQDAAKRDGEKRKRVGARDD